VEFASVPPVDTAAVALVENRRRALPAGLLGTLGPVVDRLAGIRGSAHPVAPTRVRLVVFAADHAIARRGVSAWPDEDTARRATEIASTSGTVARLAALAGVGIRVVDVGVGADLSATAVDLAHRPGGPAGPIDMQDAMTAEVTTAALAAGRDLADAEVDAGADMLIGAVCGVGVSTPTAVLVSAVTGMEPVDATTRGSGIDDAAWIRKVAIVRDARYRTTLAGTDVVTLLRTAGGPDLAALTGFVAQAAVRRTPVLVDDVPSTLAAVLAHRLAPGADGAVIVASQAPERTHNRLLELLGLEPLLALSISDGPATAAMLAVPLIRAAATLVDDADPAAPVVRSPSAINSWDSGLL